MNEKSKIYNFVVNNEKLEKLELELNKFNPLNILNISNHEIRHSNVLGWIIDPNGHHNLNDIILKKIIAHIYVDPLNKEILPSNFNFQDVYLSSFIDAKVYREKDNIDLLVISESNKFILLIENKIHAKESLIQLKKYLDKIKDNYQGYCILPVFLTLSGEEPKGAQYCVLDHFSISEIIENTISLYRDNMSIEVYNFIHFYLDSLRRLLLMDDSTKKLCREIYKEHKEAIDIIYSVGNDLDISIASQDFKEKFSETDSIEITSVKQKLICFKLDAFNKIPKMNIDWGGGYPISFWFSEYYGSLKLVLEIGPFEEPQKRIDFLLLLEKKGIKIRESAKQPNKKYTRICTGTEKIKDWQDKDELIEKMIKLYNKKNMVETKQKLLATIDEFEW